NPTLNRVLAGSLWGYETNVSLVYIEPLRSSPHPWLGTPDSACRNTTKPHCFSWELSDNMPNTTGQSWRKTKETNNFALTNLIVEA
ncbi:MAG: hypothetical protein ACYTXT_35585, partial [Nostoc sp.]